MPAKARAAAGPPRIADRRVALAGVAALALESVLALAGAPVAGLSVAALLLAPGLALAGILPVALRRNGLALACAVPVLGFAAASIALITAARIGIPLTGFSTRAALWTIVGCGLAFLPLRGPIGRPGALECLLLGAAIGAGVVLQARVLHGDPVPGNDWAKYVLYGDEIRNQRSLLIDNPFWMLGVPFREDPGTPSIYGAWLLMTGERASALAHGIWIFAVLGIGAVFAYVRTFWGASAAGLAALLYAVVPMNQDILGWHGLANVAALALMPLVFAYATGLLRDGLSRRESAGLAITLVALAAAHRLSFSLTVATLGLALLIGCALRPRRRVGRDLGLVVIAAVALGWGVAADLIARSRTFGGTQGYEAYVNSKVDLQLVILDLTWPLAIAAAVAVALGLWRVRRDHALLVPLALTATCAVLAYSWVVHFPLSYLRMVYFLPLAFAPLVAIAAVRLARRPWPGTVAALALTVAIGGLAVGRADDVRRFYSFADPRSIRGLDAVARDLRPGEVVVTDRCWSFLATWLLRTRTLPALAPEDIQPKAELATATRAQQVLDGLPVGVRAARRLGVRYVLVDPTCTSPAGEPLQPPLIGTPVYASGRLVVLRMPDDPRGPSSSARASSAP